MSSMAEVIKVKIRLMAVVLIIEGYLENRCVEREEGAVREYYNVKVVGGGGCEGKTELHHQNRQRFIGLLRHVNYLPLSDNFFTICLASFSYFAKNKKK